MEICVSWLGNVTREEIKLKIPKELSSFLAVMAMKLIIGLSTLTDIF